MILIRLSGLRTIIAGMMILNIGCLNNTDPAPAVSPLCTSQPLPEGIGEPIPQGHGTENATAFKGNPATRSATPLPPTTIPAHPFLAPPGRNGIHGDSYSTGTYAWPGPLGVNPEVRSLAFGGMGGECATVTIDRRGRLISVCSDFDSMRLVLIDPATFKVLATHDLPVRESHAGGDIEEILNDTSGGAYFHLDHLDRPIIANAQRHIQVFALDAPGGTCEWTVAEEYDLNPYLETGARVTDAIPDWEGRLWFVTRKGVVGTVDRDSGRVETMQLEGEEIQNAITVGEDGVFILSDFALYRFEADPTTGMPHFTWRETYTRGSATKRGSINLGSGTTPTLLQRDLVAIADNRDEQIHVLVYHRGATADQRLICSVPVFEPGQSATDNSLIGYGRSVIVENNFGYTTPFDMRDTAPGVVRIDVREDLSGCDVVWTSDEASQTTVPKLSIPNGLIYLYTSEPGTTRSSRPWYLTAVDFHTGETVFKILTGTGMAWNNNWAPITLGPDGTAYAGVLNGLIAVRDGEQ